MKPGSIRVNKVVVFGMGISSIYEYSSEKGGLRLPEEPYFDMSIYRLLTKDKEVTFVVSIVCQQSVPEFSASF